MLFVNSSIDFSVDHVENENKVPTLEGYFKTAFDNKSLQLYRQCQGRIQGGGPGARAPPDHQK